MALTCWKSFSQVEKIFSMYEMTYICGERLKYVGNGLDMWKTFSVYGNWLKYVGNGLDIWNMAYKCWRLLSGMEVFACGK